jgi:hypothetical protein
MHLDWMLRHYSELEVIARLLVYLRRESPSGNDEVIKCFCLQLLGKNKKGTQLALCRVVQCIVWTFPAIISHRVAPGCFLPYARCSVRSGPKVYTIVL